MSTREEERRMNLQKAFAISVLINDDEICQVRFKNTTTDRYTQGDLSISTILNTMGIPALVKL